ncbi:hypothetical protein GCM10009776_34330 [Microbacterium deminutum]|uniref:Uncharacterized protein n=1 Tax=Microbacterium deminutum TaxID=344164 RepID=A0ABN2RGB4_9MICO
MPTTPIPVGLPGISRTFAKRIGARFEPRLDLRDAVAKLLADVKSSRPLTASAQIVDHLRLDAEVFRELAVVSIRSSPSAA